MLAPESSRLTGGLDRGLLDVGDSPLQLVRVGGTDCDEPACAEDAVASGEVQTPVGEEQSRPVNGCVSSGMLIIALLILVGGLVISDPDGALTNLATENFKQLQGSATTGIESRRSTR